MEQYSYCFHELTCQSTSSCTRVEKFYKWTHSSRSIKGTETQLGGHKYVDQEGTHSPFSSNWGTGEVEWVNCSPAAVQSSHYFHTRETSVITRRWSSLFMLTLGPRRPAASLHCTMNNWHMIFTSCGTLGWMEALLSTLQNLYGNWFMPDNMYWCPIVPKEQ